MYHKQANKTAAQSQHMIVDALFRMMKRKHFQKITVTEICEDAGLGRKTFYRNFELREDVVDFWVDLRCKEYEEELRGLETDQMLRHHLEFLKKHAEILILLYQNDLSPLMTKKFSVFLPDTMPIWAEDPVEQEYRSQYIIAGIEAIVQVWVSHGFRETVEQIVDLTQRMQEKWLPVRSNDASK